MNSVNSSSSSSISVSLPVPVTSTTNGAVLDRVITILEVAQRMMSELENQVNKVKQECKTNTSESEFEVLRSAVRSFSREEMKNLRNAVDDIQLVADKIQSVISLEETFTIAL